MRIKKDLNFISFFDEKTGQYFRTGIIVNGKHTKQDPFMASFPELLDIGIMGHCIHGKAGLCVKAGIECYQNGLNAKQKNMSLSDFRNISEQCYGKTFQFALGGCGDPDQHESFEEILKICREFDIVPNFTTSGLGMTAEKAALCKECCGAVAVSWYRSDYTQRAIKMLVDAGVRTNIHYVLTRDTIREAVVRLQNNAFPDGVNAIIFLLHKPVGLGTYERIVKMEDEAFWELIHYVSESELKYKIGFDSCTVPALINHLGNLDLDCLDTCEGARWSAYITPDMKMLPCSFDNQEQRWAVNLRKCSMEEAWHSDQFEEFRDHFRTSCPDCSERKHCMGGCPICPEIVLCHNRFSNYANPSLSHQN